MSTIFRSSRQFFNCEIVALPVSYDRNVNAFGLQKHSPYLDIINFYLRRMKQTGSLNQILEKYELPEQVCPDYNGKALGFNSVFTAFLPLVLGATMGLFLFGFEWTVKRNAFQPPATSTVNLKSKSRIQSSKSKLSGRIRKWRFKAINLENLRKNLSSL